MQEQILTKRVVSPHMEERLYNPFKLFDHGSITLIDYMGDDSSVVQAARCSCGKGTKAVSEDKSLIRYMMRANHWSPFEMAEIKLRITMPIFVMRQWMRHSGSYNEYSGRYSLMMEENYLPSVKRMAKQSGDNKQGSGEAFTEEESRLIQNKMQEVFDFQAKIYDELIERNLARELARIIKSTGGYTVCYWKTNLRDLLHFCRQRSDSHAQKEIRTCSDLIREEFLKGWVPNTYEAYKDYIQNARPLSALEQRYLFDRITGRDDGKTIPQGMSKREWSDFNKWYANGVSASASLISKS